MGTIKINTTNFFGENPTMETFDPIETTNVVTDINSLPLALTVAETATALRIGKSAVYDLVRCGRIRSITIGARIRIPRSALSEFLGA